jgi:hypothetical protein
MDLDFAVKYVATGQVEYIGQIDYFMLNLTLGFRHIYIYFSRDLIY